MTQPVQEVRCSHCNKAFDQYFSALDSSDLLHLQEVKICKTYPKGKMIFLEGEKPMGMFCIKEGRLKIFKNGADGREHITRLAFPGEFVGMKALLAGTSYSVSAQTLEESTICFINKANFFELTIKYPEFTQALIGCLGKQLVEAETKMCSLAHKPVKQRLAETLLFLYQEFLLRNGMSHKLYINLTRQDLANIIGTAQETVIRLLKEFKDDQIVTLRGRKIYITHVGKLKKIAGGLS